jgi:hypothetical protein
MQGHQKQEYDTSGEHPEALSTLASVKCILLWHNWQGRLACNVKVDGSSPVEADWKILLPSQLIIVPPAYGFSALALVKCSNEGGPGPRHNNII